MGHGRLAGTGTELGRQWVRPPVFRDRVGGSNGRGDRMMRLIQFSSTFIHSGIPILQNRSSPQDSSRLEGAEEENKDGTTPTSGFKSDPHAHGISRHKAPGRDPAIAGELADVECHEDDGSRGKPFPLILFCS